MKSTSLAPHEPAEVDRWLDLFFVEHQSQWVKPEPLDLDRSWGRILGQQVVADRDQPPFHRAAMDGFAIALVKAESGQGSLGPWTATHTLGAGQDPSPFRLSPRGPQEAVAVEIMTGAAVPEGFNCVVRYEDCLWTDQGDGTKLVQLHPGAQQPKNWENIHLMGSDYERGETLCNPGLVINSALAAVLATVGLVKPLVRALPSVHVVGTGTELVSPGHIPNDYQIRASNLSSIRAELSAWGLSEIQGKLISDDPQAISEQLANSIGDNDLVIVTGAVSKGRFDWVPQILRDIGVRITVHGVLQRPGKPLLLGHRGSSLVIGLPGNPVSAITCLRRYLIPALVRHSLIPPLFGTISLPVVLARDWEFKPALTNFALVRAEFDPSSGQWRAFPVQGNGSGDLFSVAKSSGFVQMPKGPCQLKAGAVLPLYPWGPMVYGSNYGYEKPKE